MHPGPTAEHHQTVIPGIILWELKAPHGPNLSESYQLLLLLLPEERKRLENFFQHFPVLSFLCHGFHVLQSQSKPCSPLKQPSRAGEQLPTHLLLPPTSYWQRCQGQVGSLLPTPIRMMKK